MASYILRRLFLMIPTLLGIMVINFLVVQFVPGGPVERMLAVINGNDSGATSHIPGGGRGEIVEPRSSPGMSSPKSKH